MPVKGLRIKKKDGGVGRGVAREADEWCGRPKQQCGRKMNFLKEKF